MKMSLHAALGLALGLAAVPLTPVSAAAEPVPEGERVEKASLSVCQALDRRDEAH